MNTTIKRLPEKILNFFISTEGRMMRCKLRVLLINLMWLVLIQSSVMGSVWKFDGDANDETGVNNGTVTGAQFVPNGQQEQALEFDGDLDYVDFGNDSSLNMGTNNFSISFWFKKRWADDVYTSILYKATPRQSNVPGYGFLLRETGGDLKFTIGDGETIAQAVGPGIRDTEWHHAVGVRDGDTIKLYLDTALRAEADDTVGSVDNNENLVLGMGGYGNNPGGPYAGCYFRGKIDELKIFDKALTASEINQMYQNDVANHREPPTVILNSPADGETNVLTSPVLDVTMMDIDGDTMDVSFYGSSTNASQDEFTIIVLPDTQLYVDPGTYAHIFTQQTQWIVDNKDALNIVFVTHEGDIVNNWDNISEWEHANESMSLLDGVVPWGVLPGNHDQEFPGSFPHNAYYYNQYFNYTRFEQYSWYGGHYGDNNDNNYQLFSAGGMDFIIIHLEYNPSDEVLDWADELLSTYSDRRGIIDSHYIVRYHGGWSTIGEKIFNALNDNPNLFLMLCGHDPNGAGRRTDIVNNTTIHSLMTNYQSRPNGGNGWLKILTFSPKDNKIYVKTYSPYLDSYRVYTSERFNLDYQMTDYTEIGTNSGVQDGSSTTVTWSGLADSTKYYWYVRAIDSNLQTAESKVWKFITNKYGFNLFKVDINEDGKANVQDVQACVNHISGTQDWGEKADVNGDGTVNEADLQEIVNIILGE